MRGQQPYDPWIFYDFKIIKKKFKFAKQRTQYHAVYLYGSIINSRGLQRDVVYLASVLADQ
jgi:hypothetical protein